MKSYFTSTFIIIFLCSLWFCEMTVAQQLPLFTQYREYHSYINPASISADYFNQEYNLNVGASYRQQWVGLADAPQSIFVKGEYILPTKAAFDLSFGGYLLGRNTDPIRSNGVYGKIAALFTEDPYYGAFSLGFTFGALQYGINADELIPFHANDNIIASGNYRQMVPDVGFGLYYYKQFRDGMLEGDVMYGGLSIPQILGATANFNGIQSNFSIQQERHVYGVAGFYKYLNELSFIEPSIWLRYVPNAPLQIDILARYQHNQTFWAGIGGATSKILHIEGGVFAGKNTNSSLKIGFGFDYPIGGYGTVLGPAYEFNIAYLIDTKRNTSF